MIGGHTKSGKQMIVRVNLAIQCLGSALVSVGLEILPHGWISLLCLFMLDRRLEISG